MWLSVLLFAGVAWGSLAENVVVRTRLGEVRGSRVSTGPSEYVDVFLGIPYARPPVGRSRFRRPQRPQPWPGVRDGTQFGPVCHQPFTSPTLPVSEDCLNLNVYVPKAATARRPLSVMVWIHGGGFMQGSGAYYNGTELAQRGVIVVTINYRLDVLGFMSTLDSNCPGNFGLLDQISALRWIQTNIASFRGNPQDVTVFGQSAGAAAVSFLRLSPLARGLFHKAIMESGGSVGAWTGGYPANTSQPLAMARALGAKVGCNNVSTAALVTCLRRQPAVTLINASASLNLEITESFLPVMGDAYGVLPAHPYELLRQGKGRHVTSIRGVNADEYLYFTLVYTGLSKYEPDKAEQTIRNVLSRSFPLHVLDNVTRAAVQLYVTRPGRTSPEQIRYAYSELMTDFYYVAPVVLETKLTARIPSAARQYLYVFDYTPGNASWTGVPHETELPFVFGQAASHQTRFYNMPRFTWTPADTAMSDRIMTMWTNLAKFGNPTPEEVNGTTWAPYTVATQSYLNISTRLLTGSHLRQEQVEFWSAIFQDLYT
ncbi:hypothetical protein C0Q70_16607 [Pomacea canaliculata]|uniref:Carboxylic ester hydrolase n=2 Tax=Pomacea canaliculata TaxID=400727 RepID=A0A2T7NQ89_POMCA|nr:hypothetical protein C0Q70_16607 [Pomacea canaliculata]